MFMLYFILRNRLTTDNDFLFFIAFPITKAISPFIFNLQSYELDLQPYRDLYGIKILPQP